MARRPSERERAWRPLAGLLEADAGRVRERIERLDLPPAERAIVLDLLARRGC
jgi:hypothetical protein